jgi:hypothetical protein
MARPASYKEQPAPTPGAESSSVVVVTAIIVSALAKVAHMIGMPINTAPTINHRASFATFLVLIFLSFY